MAPSTRELFIRSGAELFARHGFAPVGLDRVIASVGVTKTTFYNHFSSKDDLILAVLASEHEREMGELIADVRARAPGDPVGQVLAIFDVFHDWFADPDFRGCFFMNAATEFPMDTDPIHLAAVSHGVALRDFVAELCAHAGFTSASASSVADQISVLLAGAVITRRTSKRLDAALIARRTAQALLSAAGPAPVATPAVV